VKAPGTENKTTFLSAHSWEALYKTGIPQAVTSLDSAVHGICLRIVDFLVRFSFSFDTKWTVNWVTTEVGKTYEKITSVGKLSPGLSVVIAAPWGWIGCFRN
jgi:hypothetical protein